MPSKREWLVSKGLAKRGRGRLSKPALKAIEDAEKEGVVFSEPSQEYRATLLSQDDIEPEPPVRDIGEELLGYTRGGYKFGFSHCRACGKNINYCKCSDGIVAPAIIETLPDDSPARIVRK